MAKEMCPICYDDLNDDSYQVICWNDHQLCRTCYQTHKQSRHAKCPECRGDMIDWDIVAVVMRPRRCGICREEGHNRRTCPQNQAPPATPVQEVADEWTRHLATPVRLRSGAGVLVDQAIAWVRGARVTIEDQRRQVELAGGVWRGDQPIHAELTHMEQFLGLAGDGDSSETDDDL